MASICKLLALCAALLAWHAGGAAAEDDVCGASGKMCDRFTTPCCTGLTCSFLAAGSPGSPPIGTCTQTSG